MALGFQKDKLITTLIVIYHIFLNNSWGDNFYFRTKRGRLSEGDDYFKIFSQEVEL